MKFNSNKQKELFNAIEGSGMQVFSCGPKGVSANLVGKFTIRKNHKGEDQLDVDDGTNHVHIDWTLVTRFEVGEFHGEGMLTFFNNELSLFKFYRLEGPYSNSIDELSGSLTD
ncbi:MAG: hypothetical protein HOO06_06785 [Bdellovibrionaceae bacterium]|mgnify:CR=1 FL=1|jgi:hypothetical protein|nr:hypothetical protein [Pseudobdellovibrionaceae bacterium]